MFDRPLVAYAVLVAGAVLAFGVSGVGHGTTLHTGGARYWVGAIGWAAFGVLLVATALYTLILAARTLARGRTPSTFK